MSHIDVMKQALEALRENSLLVNGDDKSGGLVWCMDGYYADCFDIEAVNKQTDEAITALNQAIAEAAPDKMADNAKELGLSYGQLKCKYGNEPASCRCSPMDCQCEIDAFFEQPAPAQESDPDELTIAYMSGLHEGKKIGAKEGRNKLATWMMQCGFATGHGDTLEELLYELDTEIEDRLAAREWVGLTDEDIVSLLPITGHRPATTFARDVEAKLKEKNT